MGESPQIPIENMLRLTTFLAGFCVFASASQKWPGLRTTFGLNPFGGFFHPQPRTVAEAEADGWTKISSCGDEGKFVGNRYKQTTGHSLILIFDDAGYIAGSQSIIRTLYIEDNMADFESHPAYQLDYIGDWEAYLTTVYYVDPQTICNGGRTEAEFNRDGTGDRLVVQVGESPEFLVEIPQYQEDALAEADWYEHKCFAGMGKHVIGFNYDSNQDCGSVMPLQILYHEGELSGFVWQHNTDIPQDSTSRDIWEKPDAMAVGAIVRDPPTCLTENTKNPGVSTMHHYFLNNPWMAIC